MAADPIRTCTGCLERRPQSDLIRVATRPAGVIGLDPKSSGESSSPEARPGTGRGAYVCPRRVCVERATSSKALQRALRIERLPEGISEKLLSRCEETPEPEPRTPTHS